ncbi:hypothetical protein [Turneriella parva]|uniref:Uncharacterized protein n=1 Tax=Turneriella parva (strain ATCC BAA-1111 / DSM 21527 / NCTC 11395 / H) TaxID=869212 RepID=I4B9J6_TURPD|nr:hypothetical protein [Turneriella parva]AFM13953.1 hypothetical protein Turpa_3315 [Turneriella parva DSM 21527]
MNNWISIAISLVAVTISLVTAWLTFFRRGRLRMTQPTVIYLGPDGKADAKGDNKIFLRTLLYATAKRGLVVESMHIALERGESKQNFSIWVYGEQQMYRGSGLYVNDTGLTYNHHFLLPRDSSDFQFSEGEHRLRVFAKIVDQNSVIELFNTRFTVTKTQAEQIRAGNSGLYFDWGPDSQQYHSHLEPKPEPDITDMFTNLIKEGVGKKKRKKLTL